MLPYVLLILAGVWAGTQNALAGGGSFITLPALIASGMDAKLANITSTLALFPGQITTGWAGRSLVAPAQRVSFRALALIALGGGIGGAFLLTATPGKVFAAMVPWLVLAATGLFAWSSFGPKPAADKPPPPAWVTAAIQIVIGVYGGFFGGGAGIMTLASLTLAGLPVRNAGGTKNVLVGLSNIAAAVVFAVTVMVEWDKVLAVGAGSMAGGYLGARALKVLPERVLKIGVVVIGLALTVALFVRAH